MGGKASKDTSSGVQQRVQDIEAGDATGSAAATGRKMSRKEKRRSKKLAKQESKRLKAAQKRSRSKSSAKYAANGGNSLDQADLDAQAAQRELANNQSKSEAIRSKSKSSKNGKGPPVRPPPPSEAVLQRATMMAQDPATQWMQVEEHRQQSSGGVNDAHTKARGASLVQQDIERDRAREQEMQLHRSNTTTSINTEISVATNLESAAAKEKERQRQREADEKERQRQKEEDERLHREAEERAAAAERAKQEQARVEREEAEAQAQRELEAKRQQAAAAEAAAQEEALEAERRREDEQRIAQAKAEEDRRQQEALAKQEAEAREAEEKARREAKAKEAEEKARREAEAKEAEEKARREAEEKAKREAEVKEAEEKARREAEAKEAEEKAKREAEARAQQERAEAARKQREDDERRRQEAIEQRKAEEAKREADEAARRLQASKDAEARREAEKAAMAAFDKPKPASESSTPTASPFGAVLRSGSRTNATTASPLPTRTSAPNVASAPATPAARTGSTISLLNKFGSQSAGSSPSGGNDDEYEELDKRAVEAAQWVDKEIRKLIGEIQRMGSPTGPGGRPQITYGPLFVETANTFEALSGTLKTAKKYAVVDYEGELLYQGASDNVVITLLKDTFDGVVIKRRKKSALKTGAGAKSKGFETSTLQNAQQKCHICAKTVYPMEFVGAASKAFHKACFRCCECKMKLKATNYCCSDDMKFYCKTHYMAAVNSGNK